MSANAERARPATHHNHIKNKGLIQIALFFSKRDCLYSTYSLFRDLDSRSAQTSLVSQNNCAIPVRRIFKLSPIQKYESTWPSSYSNQINADTILRPVTPSQAHSYHPQTHTAHTNDDAPKARQFASELPRPRFVGGCSVILVLQRKCFAIEVFHSPEMRVELYGRLLTPAWETGEHCRSVIIILLGSGGHVMEPLNP